MQQGRRRALILGLVFAAGLGGVQAQSPNPSDELCARLTADVVSKIMGTPFVRQADPTNLFCQYGDPKKSTRYFSLGRSEFSEAA
jgi:hypothetical protein